ncbi:hypothetical protein D9M68_732470 [compost metagenome]
MTEALRVANELDEQRQTAGFDQAALDEAARRGFSNGAFEDNEEDVGAIVEEFFPVEISNAQPSPQPTLHTPSKPSLAEKLEAQCQHQSLNA